MGIVYVECCERKRCCCCCDDDWDRCPNPVRRNEPASCEVSRIARSNEPFVAAGLEVLFLNQLVKYNSQFCAGLGLGYRTPTYEELESIVGDLITPNTNTPLCPMLVWATRFGKPVLAEVDPANDSVRLVRTPSKRCRAYPICVRPD
ncbi:hypothetical protein FZC76_03865 [Sutcliffiella horikoshii]|uniref:Uncharacterized protein n=1 Tax=Sutcliffiella horikoshii TaxID=79883 RepID=A0A5D4T5Q2_9BACI|nr:hypothetical protein [Sutcliffiella horikoshii]TYS71040.1 hypothetical protein FZC76_03865 [Sutcliffiella horikoshii]